MPNLDGGHYFFTALVPVRNVGIVEHQGMKSSPIHMLRETLETLPTALQSHATEEVGIQSPFARSQRTHFARFVVIDQPFYNGRDHADALISALAGTDLLKAEPHDSLACPFLMVMLDFDPVSVDAAGEPRAYFEHLWPLMPVELTAIFTYCYDFAKVTDAKSFADFMLGCQVETTMPFNDYWIGAPPLTSLSKLTLAAIPLALLAAPLLSLFWLRWPWWGALLVGLVLALVGLLIDYRIVMSRGARPFPTSDASLGQVLKALYLQQAFASFAIARQEDGAPAGPAFRAFLERHRPRDLDGPTQKPGVIRTPAAEIVP